MDATPFTVAIPDADVEDLRRRLKHTRWADDFGNEDSKYGIERGWLGPGWTAVRWMGQSRRPTSFSKSFSVRWRAGR